MNIIKKLTQFQNTAALDSNLSPTHMSLFYALLQNWIKLQYPTQMQINRDDIMKSSKISSKATYHKAMTLLHRRNYIHYVPSYHPTKGSLVSLFPTQTNLNFSPENNLTKNQTSTKNEPVQILSTRLINEPSNILYNNTHIINHNMSIARAQNNIAKTSSKNDYVSGSKKEKSCAKKEKEIPPHLDSVIAFFRRNNSSEAEARNFYNHYSSNGWLVGGRTPMRDWIASASKWISNAATFQGRSFTNAQVNTIRAKHLNTSTNKNYNEPL